MSLLSPPVTAGFMTAAGDVGLPPFSTSFPPTKDSDKMARFSTGLLVVALLACMSASRAVYVNGERQDPHVVFRPCCWGVWQAAEVLYRAP